MIVMKVARSVWKAKITFQNNYVEELDKLSRLSWLFVSPEKEEKFKFPKGDFKKFILQF